MESATPLVVISKVASELLASPGNSSSVPFRGPSLKKSVHSLRHFANREAVELVEVDMAFHAVQLQAENADTFLLKWDELGFNALSK